MTKSLSINISFLIIPQSSLFVTIHPPLINHRIDNKLIVIHLHSHEYPSYVLVSFIKRHTLFRAEYVSYAFRGIFPFSFVCINLFSI